MGFVGPKSRERLNKTILGGGGTKPIKRVSIWNRIADIWMVGILLPSFLIYQLYYKIFFIKNKNVNYI